MAESTHSADAASRCIAAALDAKLAGHGPSGDAFVVSVYGEWGVGKTRCLKQLFRRYDEPRSDAISKLGEQKLERLVIPVFFEAWRYEHEQHLIVPLLKTIELQFDITASELWKAILASPKFEPALASTMWVRAQSLGADWSTSHCQIVSP